MKVLHLYAIPTCTLQYNMTRGAKAVYRCLAYANHSSKHTTVQSPFKALNPLQANTIQGVTTASSALIRQRTPTQWSTVQSHGQTAHYPLAQGAGGDVADVPHNQGCGRRRGQAGASQAKHDGPQHGLATKLTFGLKRRLLTSSSKLVLAMN